MEVLEIGLLGPRTNAERCAAAFGRHGFTAQVAEDGPGPSGINNQNPRLLDELRESGIDPDVKVVDVEASSDDEFDLIVEVAAEYGYRPRVHGWVTR